MGKMGGKDVEKRDQKGKERVKICGKIKVKWRKRRNKVEGEKVKLRGELEEI